MSKWEFLLPLLIAASAVPFAIFAGRAQASRMRELGEDIVTGKARGHLVILVVLFMVFASSIF